MDRRYNVVVRNDRTGEDTQMNATPMTHAEAVTFWSKLIPDAERPKHLRSLLVEVTDPPADPPGLAAYHARAADEDAARADADRDEARRLDPARRNDRNN